MYMNSLKVQCFCSTAAIFSLYLFCWIQKKALHRQQIWYLFLSHLKGSNEISHQRTKNLKLPSEFGWQRAKREGRRGSLSGASAEQECQEAWKALSKLAHSHTAREAGVAWQPDVSYEIASLLSCWGRSSSSETPVEEIRWSYLGLLSHSGGGQEAGVLRLEWEPTAEEKKPLADFTVVGIISHVPGSAASKGSGSWRGREDGNSSLFHLSPVRHCSGCWLETLCHIERITFKNSLLLQ